MTLLVIIFGLISGSLFSVLVGLVGSGRRIGFGAAFLISLILTPLVGLIITLLSEPIYGKESGIGCIGTILGLIALMLMVAVALLILGVMVI